MKHPGWAVFVSIAFATLVFLATLTRIMYAFLTYPSIKRVSRMWYSRKTAHKYIEEWDKVMARCRRGETIGELLSTSEQVLRAECTW